jgi:16S rRNA (cytidine1402-2'-O)-methyltransferase
VDSLMAGTLFIVGTPIGNLEDITLRAIRTLKEADTVAAEDTRVTRKLLAHFDIHKPLLRLVENERGIRGILEELKSGRDVALVVDAGVPAISDPGELVVEAAVDQGMKVVPIPGPTALTAALSVTDIPFYEFTFLGFPPTKKGRKTFFEGLPSEGRPLVLYESPYRIVRTLEDLRSVLGERDVVVGRELTKLHEEIFRGALSEAVEHFRKSGGRGEFVIVVGMPAVHK